MSLYIILLPEKFRISYKLSEELLSFSNEDKPVFYRHILKLFDLNAPYKGRLQLRAERNPHLRCWENFNIGFELEEDAVIMRALVNNIKENDGEYDG